MTQKELFEMIVLWENIPLLIQQLESGPDELEMLMNLALESDSPKSWRAAYIADKINDDHPELIAPFLPQMISKLKTENNLSKKRHYLKLISQHDFPAQYYSFLVDYCLGCFTSASEPIANRVHAMQVLFNISESEPDFKPELLSVIEQEMEFHPTPGILSRGRKLARKLFFQIQKL
ncbi:hypothetical protein SAMN05444274_10910 [Mariniphaga anaerophila]|uniref:HEAT repeat-containing protein n=1 Tax=Mariniphaga anaerophila TaxID=1484053 RepID=A0A1M5EF52_9BACT|nr:hypothetical protein [Mariniphaga anaerophila]SHF77816.1 hypothetical protein SAMN05444274_10910 [Mariniphaga anaerophila]